MPSPENPLTIRALADQLQLSAMTVSRALRNATGVSAATRKLVLTAATHHGYRPDPSLAVLNAYRRGKRHLLPHETIAYLTNFPTSDEWRRIDPFQRTFLGAQTRAGELGYALEPFWVGDPALTDRRSSQILSSRGIRGVIIGPLYHGGAPLNLDWSQFTAVALGRSLLEPGLTTVSTNHMQAVELAWQKAWARGYRRIGLVLTEEEEWRTKGTLHAAHFLQQNRYATVQIPILIMREATGAALIDWSQQYQPDLIISGNHRHYDLLLETDGDAGKRVKFLDLNAHPSSERCGINPGHDRVGETAITVLHQKLIRRETGIPVQRELTLLDGIWKEGRGEGRLARHSLAPINLAEPLLSDLRLST